MGPSTDILINFPELSSVDTPYELVDVLGGGDRLLTGISLDGGPLMIITNIYLFIK
jgi:hypothetical protein